MQYKNQNILRSTILLILLFIVFSISLMADPKSTHENEKKDTTKPKEALTFESCDKIGDDKCEKETKTPITDYSKSLK